MEIRSNTTSGDSTLYLDGDHIGNRVLVKLRRRVACRRMVGNTLVTSRSKLLKVTLNPYTFPLRSNAAEKQGGSFLLSASVISNFKRLQKFERFEYCTFWELEKRCDYKCRAAGQHWLWSLLTLRATTRQGSHQIKLLSLLVRIDGSSLIMIHQLIQRVELALSNAIQSAFNMDSEVFVTTWSLERHRVVAHLRRRMMKIVKKKKKSFFSEESNDEK